MNIRKFEFKDQSVVFDWWNQEGLKKQLVIYQKASEWTQRLLKNEFAFTVEYENSPIAIFEFLALYQSSSGNMAKVFYFTPFEDIEHLIQGEILKKAQELKKYKISQVQFYQWKPTLVELWVPQEEEKENVQPDETISDNQTDSTVASTTESTNANSPNANVQTSTNATSTKTEQKLHVPKKRKQPKKDSTITNNNQPGKIPVHNT